jgi:putative PEP-CTERM system histidine kinase
VPLSRLHAAWDRPLAPETSEHLQQFFQAREWVLDLHALPEAARRLPAQCPDLAALPGIRYLVPLMTESRLSGIAALTAPPAPQTLDWEDYDVIKLIARQGAAFIALREAERELADADKLRSYHQLSAFVVHDVKTIASQLSLLTENAARHKHNPAFIDDMIGTVENAVERMQKLLAQLRDGDACAGGVLDLGSALTSTVESFRHQTPAPSLCLPDQPLTVLADPARLGSAVGHIIQNAIDAANLAAGRGDCAPRVSVALTGQRPWAEIIVEDTGSGMEARFVDKELFQPFTSTKGVAGMGIGAYQARAYVRSLGGDISVDSRPGHGSRFTIRLPLEAAS